ncbi:ComEC/Rec2 family competence protein [Thalassospira mesophila]|nr:ComEC/Rec2 family competence protein [Thalassospira mesophila]
MFLGLGQAASFSLLSPPPGIVLATALAFVTIGLWVSRHRIIAFFVLLMALASLIGAVLVVGHLYFLQTPTLKKTVYSPAISGKILSVEPRGGRTRLVIAPTHIDGLKRAQMPPNIRISMTGALGVAPGDMFDGPAKLFPLGAPEAPGDPDFSRSLYFDGIGATGFVMGRKYKITPSDSFEGDVFALNGQVRLAMMARINRVLAPVEAGLANAILVGERGGVPAGLAEDLRKSGLAHLLAISGLHMGLLCGAVFFAVRLGLALIPALALRYPVKKWAAIAAMIVGLLYLLLSGATVPTQRAFVMTAIVLFAVLVDRQAISLRLVAIAALIIMVLQPDAVMGASFQLSFAAVTGLVAFYQGAGGQWLGPARDIGIWQKSARYLGLLLITGIMVTALTAPIIGFHFGRVSLLGVVANLLAIPLMAFWIMPCIVAVLAMAPFGLEFLPLTVLSPGLKILIWLARGVAQQDWGLWYLAQPAALVIIPAMMALLWMVIWRQWSIRMFVIVPVCCAIFAGVTFQRPDVLVGGGRKDWAVYDPSLQKLFFNHKVSKFHRAIWMSRYGISPERSDVQTGQCAADVCWFVINGRHIVLARKLDDPFYICRHADIVIDLQRDVPANACKKSSVIIDDDVLWWQGGTALYVPKNNDRAWYETVRNSSGNWPWITLGGR